MVKTLFSTMIIALMSISVSFGQAKTEKFLVSGSCGMCADRIEAAAKSVDGVNSAEWNKETQIITLKYDAATTDVDKVHSAIAAVGHDTGKQKADAAIYEALPGCCKYDRSKKSDTNKSAPCSEVKKSSCCGRS